MIQSEPKLVRIDPLRLLMQRHGQMVTDATIFASEDINLEPDAVRQLYDAASLPPAKKVLATADIHVGFGIPIGAVIGMDNAIMPAAVGYDINCGMRLLKTPFLKGDIDTEKIAASVARDIPLGEGKANLVLDKTSIEAVVNQGPAAVPTLARRTSHRVWEVFDPEQLDNDLECIEENGCLPAELGTLGGGNHFIEIQYVQQVFDKSLADTFGLAQNQIVVMIHSGSRRFGYEVADHYMNVAAHKTEMAERRKMLSYLNTETGDGKNYIKAMAAAANFAFTNRQIMAMLVRRCFNRMFGPTDLQLVYDVAHNMAKLETHTGSKLWVHRKGATRAFSGRQMTGSPFEKTGQPIITPGSMGTASFLMVGTEESQESLCSVNHGAGRIMSRSAARGKIKKGRVITPAKITDDQFKQSMKGIKLITHDKGRIKEEAPGAYKDIDEVVRIVVGCGWAKRVVKMAPLAVLKS